MKSYLRALIASPCLRASVLSVGVLGLSYLAGHFLLKSPNTLSVAAGNTATVALLFAALSKIVSIKERKQKIFSWFALQGVSFMLIHSSIEALKENRLLIAFLSELRKTMFDGVSQTEAWLGLAALVVLVGAGSLLLVAATAVLRELHPKRIN